MAAARHLRRVIVRTGYILGFGPVTKNSPLPAGSKPLRIARILGRLNVGGPAVQAIYLTAELPRVGIETRLFCGEEADHEGSMEWLARRLGIDLARIPGMRREVRAGDVYALFYLIRQLRRYRPDVVHTEAAKAGTVGRVAALVGLRHRPVLIHTFHGHSLEWYFSPLKARVFLGIERFLAKRTTVLLAVSDEVKDDLVRLGVASPARIQVIRLGLNLEPFQVDGDERRRLRATTRRRWGLADDDKVVTLVARLVPIKRVDRFLRIAERLAFTGPEYRFVIVGDGELSTELRASDVARRLEPRLSWVGFERDMAAVCFASDVVVQTSDNEGTPVTLIEAHAAGLPVVSTRVGGTASVVRDGVSGRLVDRESEEEFAEAIREVVANPGELGEAGRRHVLALYGLDQLVGRLAIWYRAVSEKAVTEAQTPSHSASSSADMGPAR